MHLPKQVCISYSILDKHLILQNRDCVSSIITWKERFCWSI